MDPTEVAAVNKNSKFRVSLYKALLFLHVQSAIKSGSLNLEHSYKYRPLIKAFGQILKSLFILEEAGEQTGSHKGRPLGGWAEPVEPREGAEGTARTARP
jgi:hypothetical protein